MFGHIIVLVNDNTSSMSFSTVFQYYRHILRAEVCTSFIDVHKLSDYRVFVKGKLEKTHPLPFKYDEKSNMPLLFTNMYSTCAQSGAPPYTGAR